MTLNGRYALYCRKDASLDWSTPQNFNEGSLGRVDPYTIGGIKMRHSINVWPFVILYYAYYESSYIRLSNDTRSLTLKDVG